MGKLLKLSSYFLLTLIGIIALTIIVLGQKDIPRNELKLKYTNDASKFMPMMGMQVHYRDEGNPKDTIPLVLIHGTSSSLHTWEKVTSILNEPMYGNKRVITLDMPAFGLTGPNPENKYSYETYTRLPN